MTRELIQLGDVLANPDQYDPGDSLYLPMDEVWGLETRCEVMASSESEERLENCSNGLSYAIQMEGVQGVVANAREQLAAPAMLQLLEAFLFYCDRDAFIEFGE